MQSLLYAGPIWGGIQQPSWRVQPNAAPVEPPTSMRFMFSVFRLQNLCWILMFVLDTYVRAWDVWDLCLCWVLVLNTYVCDGYLCLCWIFMFVMIYVIYMWYLLFVWMEYKKQIKKVYTGHFAECDTQQRGALPSVRVITLGKEPKPGHQFRYFAKCYVVPLGKEAGFAECRTEHSAKSLTWGPSLVGSLLSVPEVTRQRCILCRVLLGRHSAKVTPLPSVVCDTRQRRRLHHPSL